MRGIILVLVLFFSSAANAYTVTYDGAGNVLAVGNLNIDGTLYNVDFETGVYGTYAGDELFWVGTGMDLSTVSSAVNNALNSEGAVSTVIGDYYLVVESDIDIGFGDYVWQNGFTEAWQIWSGAVPDGGNILGRTAWSVAVPIPAAAWFLGSGLLCLGFFRRRIEAP